jgi:hypothetical protein
VQRWFSEKAADFIPEKHKLQTFFLALVRPSGLAPRGTRPVDASDFDMGVACLAPSCLLLGQVIMVSVIRDVDVAAAVKGACSGAVLRTPGKCVAVDSYFWRACLGVWAPLLFGCRHWPRAGCLVG